MAFVYLILATICAILLAVKLIMCDKYLYLVENLDTDEFPLASTYCVGLSWSQKGPLALKGKLRETLIGQAKLLYDPQYAEYYAGIVWAETLTFVHLGLTLGFVLAALTQSGLMVIIGIAIAVVFGFYAINRMNEQLKTREQECNAELPEIVSSMALLMNAGMTLRDAWNCIAKGRENTIYLLMRQACVDMENGMSEIDAIHKFGRMSNSAEVRKFTSALAQSMERGGAELTGFLGRQSVEIWALKKQSMLQKGEEAASKLLAPTAMLFIGIIISVFSGAIGMLF